LSCNSAHDNISNSCILHSEEWSHTLVDVKFLDTVSGDSVVALRNNKGGPSSTGPPEHFVSIHPRAIQQRKLEGAMIFDLLYGTSQDRIDRLTLFKMTTSDIQGIDTSQEQILGITDMFVLPTGKGDGRQPWVLLSVVVAPAENLDQGRYSTMNEDGDAPPTVTGSFTDSYRRDICINLNLDIFVTFGGSLEQSPHVCNLNSFFEVVRGSGYNPVVLYRPDSMMRADIALLPSRRGVDMCILKLQFATLSRLSDSQTKYCFSTPDSFATGAQFPLRNGWSDFQREMFLGYAGGSEQQRTNAMTQEGTIVPAAKITAQNSLSFMDMNVDSSASGGNLRMQLFATGDPAASTHWLNQIRIAVHEDSSDGSAKRSVSARSTHSLEAVTTVVTYHSCDRKSCLGCETLRLQALCYAAQQCSVMNCVGTVVNQNRPLCNVGLVMKSYMEGMLSMSLGAWLVFTESYSSILDAALLGPSSSVNIEWVDDAFFGYICTAKDMLGQGTSILTSTIGAGIIESHKRMMRSERDSQGLGAAGLSEISDDAFTASVVMILNGVNSFMYQMVLFPLYTLIALQKTIVCTANDVFGVFDAAGFTVRVGRPDLQRASDVSSGVCLTTFFEKSLNEIGQTDTSDSIASSASDWMRNIGEGASSIAVAGATGQDAGGESARILTLLSGSKMAQASSDKGGVSDAVRDAPKSKGGKVKTLFEKFKSAKVFDKLGKVMGKLQLSAPIHLIDSMITYAIGVVSGMQDMAQVSTRLWFSFFTWHFFNLLPENLSNLRMGTPTPLLPSPLVRLLDL